MAANIQEQRETWPSYLDVYERAFVETVLRLGGVNGTPTDLQRARATKILQLYRLKAALQKFSDSALHSAALRGRLAQPAGAEHAFMFVRFDSVMPPDASEARAFNEWLETLPEAETAPGFGQHLGPQNDEIVAYERARK